MRLLSVLVLAIAQSPFLIPIEVQAQSTPDSSTGGASSTGPQGLSGNVDLTSTTASMTTKATDAITINVGGSVGSNGAVQGGTSTTILPGQLLTPAQYIAVQQILYTGQQTLMIGSDGSAVGGFANLRPSYASNIGSLTVPQNVAINTIGFDSNSPLNIAGNLNILGSIYTLQNAPNITSVLNSANMTLGSGALLSGYLPTNFNILGNVFASGGLSLNITNNLLNQGTITTPGTLNITTGGNIVNQTVNNVQAVMSAQSALNIISGTGSIFNSGLMSAMNAINISTLTPDTNILINNTSGIMEALNGAITVRDPNYLLKQDLTITGGDFVSRELNLYSGCGQIEAVMNNMAGSLNGIAGIAHIGVTNAETMALGNITISEDPIFYNNSGNVNISGTITTGGASSTGDLGIFASGNITTSLGAGKTIISTRATSGTSRGGNVTLIAGATTAPSGSATGGTANNSTTSAPNGNYVVTLNGGGSILLDNGNAAGTTAIDTRGRGGNSNGGNITLIARSNGGTTGRILVDGRLDTQANNSGTNGNILVIGGYNPGSAATAISIGNILTDTAGNGLAGSVSIYTSQPTTATGAPVTFTLSGSTITPSTTFVPTGGLAAPILNPNAQVDLAVTQTNGAGITVLAGGNITTSGAIESDSTNNAIPAGGNILIGSLTGDINIGGRIFSRNSSGNGSGGNVNLFAGKSVSVNGVITANASGTGIRSGGSITLVAGSSFNLSAGNLVLPGGLLETATGGSITTGNINTNGAGNGDGGAVTMLALQGSATGTEGRITTGTVSSDGSGTGSGGSVVLISEDTDAALGTVQLKVSTIGTEGGTAGSTGSVLLSTSGVSLPSALNINMSTGKVSGGTPTADLDAVSSGDISMSTVTTDGQSIRIFAGGNIIASTNSNLNSNSSNGSGGGIIAYAKAGSISTNFTNDIESSAAGTGNGGDITLVSGSASSYVIPDDIFTTGAGATGKGGNVLIVSGGNITIPTAITPPNVRGPLAGGNITLIAGGATSFSGNNLLVQGESKTGGTFTFTGAGTYAINTSGTSGSNQSAGKFTMIAYEGSAPGVNSGVINLPTGTPRLSINTRGAGAGSNGDILMIAADNTSAVTSLNIGIALDTGVVTGGSGGGGGISLAAANAIGAVTVNTSSTNIAGDTLAIDFSDLRRAVNTTSSLSTRGAGITMAAGTDITIGGNVTSNAIASGSGGSVLLAAGSGNIALGANSILASGVTGTGGNVAALAGNSITMASITNSGAGAAGTNSGGSVFLASGISFGTTAGALTIPTTGNQTTTGGSITLTGAITSNGAGNGSGGPISLIALEGTIGSATSGRVSLPVASTLSAKGSGTGSGGNVSIVAADNDAAIGTAQLTVGPVGTSGGVTGSTGAVLLAASSLSLASIMNVSTSDSAITGGPINADLNALQTGDITLRSVTTNGQSVRVFSGGNISNTAAGSTITTTASAGNGGDVLFYSLNGTISSNYASITANAAGTGNGGNVALLSGGALQSPATITSNGAGATGSGGAITLSSGGNLTLLAGSSLTGTGAVSGSSISFAAGALNTVSGSNIQIGGQSTSGGTISLTSGTLNTTGGGANSNAGNLTIVAYEGSTPGLNSGVISIPAAVTINTRGAGSGANGNILVLAGDVSSQSTSLTVSSNLDTGVVSGGTGGGGSIALGATTPTGDIQISSTNSSLQSNSLAIDLNNRRQGVSTQALSTRGASITVAGGGPISVTGAITASGITSGTGGSVYVQGNGITTTGAITSNGAGVGNGGTVYVINSATSTANTKIGGAVSASATGSGTGGTIGIGYADSSTADFVIGSAPTTSGMNGNITANGAGAAGGSIILANLIGTSTNISLTTAASAISASGSSLGSINFNVLTPGGAPVNAASSVSVTGSAAGNGTLTGAVSAQGTSVTINPRAAATILTVDSVISTASNVSLVNNNGASTVSVLNNTNPAINAAGNVSIDSPNILNTGVVQSSAAGASITLQNSNAGGNLGISGGGTYQFSSNNAANTILVKAGSTGTGVVTLGGSNTFNVGNATSAANAISFQGSQINLPAAQTQTISNNANVTFQPGAAGALTLNLTASDTSSFAGTGTYTIASNGAGNTVNVSASATPSTVSFGGATNVSTTGVGALNISNNVTLQTNNKNVTVTTASVNLNTNGAINAGTGTVILQPNAAGTTIGLNGGTGTFAVAGTTLTNITAATLQVGNNTSGAFTQAGTLNVSGAGPAGAYNLDLRSGSTYTGAGSTTILGTKTLTINSVGGATTGTIGGGATTVSVTGSAVSLGNNIALAASGSSANLTANAASAGTITQSAGTVIAANVNLSTTGAGGGSDIGNINVSATNVTANTNKGNATVTNSSAALVNLNGSTIGGNLNVSSNNTININAAVSTSGSSSLTTTANNGSISVNGGNLSGTGGVILQTQGNGSVTVADTRSIQSTNNTISVTAASVNLNTTGAINAGTGTVILQPNAAGTTVGLNGGVGTFAVTGTTLTNTTAGTLQVGNNTSGAFTQAGTLNVSSAGPAGVYNLDVRSGSTYTGAGSTTTLGTKTLTINSAGGANTGTISGGTTTVDIKGSSVAIGSTITLGASSSVNITANSGTITGTPTITATTANLSASGDIGALSPNQVTTNVTNLSAKSIGGDVHVRNTGAVTLTSGAANSVFDLTVGGALNTSIASVITAPNIYLTTTGANDITIGANVGGGAGTTTKLTAGGAVVQGAGTVSSATVNLSAANAIGASGNAVKTSGASTLSAASTNSSVFLSNSASNISDFSASAGTGGVVELTTTGNITLGNNVVGPSGVTLTTGTGASGVIAIGTKSIQASDATITLNADSITAAAGGSINAGSAGTVIVSPTTNNAAITVGSYAPFGNITAGTIQVGNLTSYVGNITVGANLTTSANLNFYSANSGTGTLSNNAAIDATGKTVNVQVGGSISNNGSGSITATTVALKSNAGSIGFGTAIKTTAGNLSAAVTTGAGNIALSNTGAVNFVASANTGSVALTNTSNITLSGNVAGPAGVTLTTGTGANGILDVNGKSIVASNTTIILNADTITASTAGSTIDAGASGTVIVTPTTNNANITVGTFVPFSKITAGTVQVGNTTSFVGAITVTANLTTVSNLNFYSSNSGNGSFINNASVDASGKVVDIQVGGSISNNGSGDIIADSVSLKSNAGSIGSGTAFKTTTSNLTANVLTGTGNIDLSNSGAVNFAASSNSGSVALANTSNITLSANVSGPAGVTLTTGTGANGTLDVAGKSILATNKTITLNADAITATAAGSAINTGATGTAIIAPSTNNASITVGAFVPFSKITAGTVQVGNTTSFVGDITIGAGLTTTANLNFYSANSGTGAFINNAAVDASGKTVNIEVGGSILNNASGNITAGNVSLKSNSGSIGAGTAFKTSTSNLTASLVTGGGNIDLTNSGAVNFSASANTGTVALSNTSNITLSGNVSGPSGVTLTTGTGANGILNIAGKSILATDKTITLNADTVTAIGGSINAGTAGTVVIAPTTNNATITVGSLVPFGSITASTVEVGNKTTFIGNINIDTDLTSSANLNFYSSNAGTGSFTNNAEIKAAGKNVNVEVGGSVSNNGLGNVTAANVSLKSEAGSIGTGTSFKTTTGNLTANVVTGPGNINLNNTGAANFAATANSGSVTLVNAGNITLSGAVTGPAGITLTTPAGGNINDGGFNINAIGTSATLTADSFTLSGSVNAGTGSIFINPASNTGNIDVGTFVPFANLNADNIQVGNSSFTGDLTISGGVINTSANLTFLSSATGNGTFTNNGILNNGSKDITINVGGDISNASGSKVIGGAITLTSNKGSIGSNSTNFEINGTSITLNAAADAFVSNKSAAPATLSASSTGGDLLLGYQGALTTSGTTNAGGNLTLLSNTSLNTTGSLTSGKGLTFTGAGFLTNDANVVANGGDIFFLSQGVVTNNSSVNAKSGSLAFTSAASGISLTSGSSTVASQNVDLSASKGDVAVGKIGGVLTTVSAGQATTSAIALMDPGTIISNGAVTINTVNLAVGDNSSISSHGGANAAHTGDLTVTASGAINVGQNNNITAYGGAMWFNSTGNINIDKGSILISVGKLSDSGGTFTTNSGAVVPIYFGGQLGLFAGNPVADPNAHLDAMVQNRTGNNTFDIVGVAFDTNSPNVSSTNGSTLQAINGNGQPMVIDPTLNNIYNLNGGVMSIRQAGTASIVFDPTFTAIGAPMDPPPPVPPTPSNPQQPSVSIPSNGAPIIGLGSNTGSNLGIPTDRINRHIALSSPTQLSTQSITMGSRENWYIAEGPEQPFALDGDSETLVIGQEGTAIAMTGERNLLVDAGKIAVLVGSKADLLVETKFGTVTVPAMAIVLIDTTNPNQVKLTNISGSTKMELTDPNKTMVQVAVGEEIVVSQESGLADPAKISTSQTSSDGKLIISKSTVDRRQILQDERLLGCGKLQDNCLSSKRVNALKSELGIMDKTPKSSTPIKSPISIKERVQKWQELQVQNSQLSPVAFSTSIGATATTMAKLATVNYANARIKHRGAEMVSIGDLLMLKRGEMLVQADQPTVIRTDAGSLKIGAGSIVLISKDSLVTKVRTVWEPKSGSVRQLLDKNHIDIPAGQEVIISNEAAAISAVYKHDSIGRRRVRQFQVGDQHVSVSEVSIITLMASSPVISAVALSKESDDLSMRGKMLKMAACLQMATAGHGTYTGFSKNP